MRLPLLSCSVVACIILLLPSLAAAQAGSVPGSTEPVPPAAVQMPTRPQPPSMPNTTLPSTVSPHHAGEPAAPKAENSLLHDMLGQSVAGRASVPKQPGNGAFGAVQEVLAILEADPKTDWGRVNLDALRAHLIDMNEVTLNADAQVEAVAGGIRVAVTGQGRTLAAIRRMVPDHAREIDGHDGWTVTTENKPDGVTLTVTAKDARQTMRIRALGFIGVMATGSHHALHHLAIARGQPMAHGPAAPARPH
jgi:hypothetical protein